MTLARALLEPSPSEIGDVDLVELLMYGASVRRRLFPLLQLVALAHRARPSALRPMQCSFPFPAGYLRPVGVALRL